MRGGKPRMFAFKLSKLLIVLDLVPPPFADITIITRYQI